MATRLPRRQRSGVPVTTAVRLAALLGHDDTVVAFDQHIGTGVVDLTDIRAVAAMARGPTPSSSPRIEPRLNRLPAAGWRIVFVTAADLRDPGALILRIAAALGLHGCALSGVSRRARPRSAHGQEDLVATTAS